MDIPAYTHKVHSRSTRLSIKIDQKNQVTVVSPPRTSKGMIDKFVLEHADWINKTIRKNGNKPQLNDSDTVTVFGKQYHKQISTSSEHPIGIHILDKTIHIRLPSSTPAKQQLAKATTSLDRWMKTTATQYIIPRVHTLAKTMNTTFAKVTLRDTTSRWGSCSSSGNLQFSWRLVHFTPQVIDYVIIHELAHRTHMNHSSRFWNLVHQFDPHYKQHRKVLKDSIV